MPASKTRPIWSLRLTAKKAEPMEPAAPSLLGTWQMTEHEEDETILWTLTFRPGRWVLVIIVRDETGAIINEYPQFGGWEQSETHITKIYHDDENDDAIAMVAKRYTLTDDTLTVEWWGDNAPGADDSTMTRVTDAAILTTLAGSQWTMDETNDEGMQQRWTLSFTDAGWQDTFDGDLTEPGRFEMGGTTWNDDGDNGVLRAVVDSVTNTEFDLQWWVDDTVHFAYVPTGEADRLRVSLWFREQAVAGEGDTRRWTAEHRPDAPYGDFGWRFTRADS